MADVVKPTVRLFFLCDDAVQDVINEKWTLTNPWHTVAMPPGVTKDFCQEELWAYVQFTGGSGEFYLSIHMFNEDGLVGNKSAPSKWELSGGNAVYEEVFHMTNVPFDKPGVYQFKVMGNHAELDGGIIELRVLPGDEI